MRRQMALAGLVAPWIGFCYSEDTWKWGGGSHSEASPVPVGWESTVSGAALLRSVLHAEEVEVVTLPLGDNYVVPLPLCGPGPLNRRVERHW